MRIERREESWRTVTRYVEQRLQELRSALERPNTDWDHTNRIRAEIKALRGILALPEALENGRISLDTD